MVDVHPAAYLKSYHAANARLQAKLLAKTMLDLPTINFDAELLLLKSRVGKSLQPLAGTVDNFGAWMHPPPFSVDAVEENYLGIWHHLFSKRSAKPFPTLEAIAWIGKDHNLLI